MSVRVDNETHKLSLQYKLVRPDIPADNAITDMVAHLREAMPGTAVYAGMISNTPGDIICR